MGLPQHLTLKDCGDCAPVGACQLERVALVLPPGTLEGDTQAPGHIHRWTAGRIWGGPHMMLRKSMWEPRGVMDEPPSSLCLGEKTEAYSPAGAARCSPRSSSGLL